jgi:hypothetical protein
MKSRMAITIGCGGSGVACGSQHRIGAGYHADRPLVGGAEQHDGAAATRSMTAMAAFAGAPQRIGVGVARDQSGIGTSALFGATGAGDSAVGAGRGRGSGGDNAADE